MPKALGRHEEGQGQVRTLERSVWLGWGGGLGAHGKEQVGVKGSVA